ncbi:MAG: hypothetical protein ACPLW8_06040 [Candidatus Bathyarchaeales archaeon]
MERMKIVKILVVLMAIATVIYIGTEAYAYVNANTFDDPDCGWIRPGAERGGWAVSAELYRGETPPPKWYHPEELGAVAILDYGIENATVVWLIVPFDSDPLRDELRQQKPIFIHPGTGRFYQISELCIAFPVPPNLPQQPVGVALCGIGWIVTGALWLNWRKEDETSVEAINKS